LRQASLTTYTHRLNQGPYGRFLGCFLGRGFSVVVTRFDGDRWERAADIGWLSDRPYRGQPLDGFLADAAAIPLEKAKRIADESLDEWRRREYPGSATLGAHPVE
jgi:hypothetical protein